MLTSWAEGLDVGAQVLADVVCITHQLLHVQCRAVAEELLSLAEHEWLWIKPLPFPQRLLLKHSRLGWAQDAVEPPEHRERKDDLAVVALLVIPSQ